MIILHICHITWLECLKEIRLKATWNIGQKNLKKDKFDSSVGNKLSLYSELKNEVRFESYLDLIKNVKTRVAVTKMRISCHLLPIESERYKKIPRVERLCPLCNRFESGDEFHYLLKCIHSSLSHIRGIFLDSLYSINSNFTNMSCNSTIFIYHMRWKHRKSQCLLYWKYSLALTKVCMGESWPRSPVQTEHSEVCTSDRGQDSPIQTT